MMPSYFAGRTGAAACVLLAAVLMMSVGTELALAGEQPSVDQIIKALTPKSATRSLTLAPASVAKNTEESQFLDSLRNRKTRSLTSNERERIAAIAEEKPSIDLEINFDYNSAKISSSAMATARTLGQALSSPAFSGSTFVVEGHTDGKGGDKYNQELSERRADAIKQFLVESYGIPASNLVPVGFGKSKLKVADSPMAAENRRVQVVNMVQN
jgi:outer membrane protein OmpA-like peptidoglycan-associated protein